MTSSDVYLITKVGNIVQLTVSIVLLLNEKK